MLEIKQHLCDSRNYRANRRGAIRYLVLHYTGNNGDTDEGNGIYFSKNDTDDTSAHYFVDEDSVTQSVPDNACAFHCGAKRYNHPDCRNDNAIGIEMCSDKDASGKFIITPATVDIAVKLTKILMAKYNIPIERVLRHYDVTGKNCPEPWVRNSELWANFKQRLEGEELTETKIKVNGQTITGYILKDDRSYAPVRELAEAFGAKVGWDEKTNTVTVTK